MTVPVTSLISALIPAPGEGVGVAGDELRRMERPAAGAARPRARCAAAGRPPAGDDEEQRRGAPEGRGSKHEQGPHAPEPAPAGADHRRLPGHGLILGCGVGRSVVASSRRLGIASRRVVGRL
ncbi:MAG TPA: hypothetical protein VKL22_04210 [Actinomycetota bacterium]|nr:hypothetical protein [Actinomycetota bacterium]